MRVDSVDDHMEANGGDGSSWEFGAKSGIILCYDVSKSDQLAVKPSKT